MLAVIIPAQTYLDLTTANVIVDIKCMQTSTTAQVMFLAVKHKAE